MENKDLVVNALRYYDKNNDLYVKIFNKIGYYSFKLSEFDLEHNIIIFYDRNKNEIFRSRYEYIGIYNPIVEIWIWAWAIPILKLIVSKETPAFFLNSSIATPKSRYVLFLSI